MTVRVLPIRVGVPFQSFQVDLDGVPFNLSFSWNERAAVWVMQISDAQGTVLRAGIRVCLGTMLLPASRPVTFPPGELLAVEEEGEGVDPTLDDLGEGERVQVVYIEAADVAEVSSG